MPFAELRAAITARLDEGDRGDRAWWLLTRVHLSAVRLQRIASYLHDAGAARELALTPGHYRNLARALNIDTADPAVVINRHYFLAMDNPLRLLERVNGRRWHNIQLTPAGVGLATETDTVGVLEKQLSEIRFCRTPWYSQEREKEYTAFNVRPYPTILAVMARSDGTVDIDEFDLFISRIRTDAEISVAIESIQAFRPLSEPQKQSLRQLVEDRIPGGGGSDPRKPYNNWRDMARHTFSLFALGGSAVRIDNALFLTAELAIPVPLAARASASAQRRPALPVPALRPAALRPRVPTALRIPNALASDDLLTPPSAPQSNSGTDAELLIGKIFASNGWEVVYYNQRRGYGFDLWVRKTGQAFVVEVKSFVGQGTSVTLTALEHQAAQHYGANFLLVVVEDTTGHSPVIYVIQNPADALRFREAQIAQFSVGRASWLPVASALGVRS